MSNNKEIAPGMFIDDSAGVFETDKFKQPDKAAIAEAEKAVEKAQYILNTTPPEVPADTQTVTTENPERDKKVSLVELCRQISTVSDRISELSDAQDACASQDTEVILSIVPGSKRLIEIEARRELVLSTLGVLRREAQFSLAKLLEKIKTKDFT